MAYRKANSFLFGPFRNSDIGASADDVGIFSVLLELLLNKDGATGGRRRSLGDPVTSG